MAKPTLTQQRLTELFDYDAQTGLLTWKVRRGCMAAGKEAGVLKADGYVEVKVDGRSILAHRLIWLLLNGELPKQDIDHIDGDKTNNRAANLRDVSTSVNCQNQRRARRDNQTGFLGVSQCGSKFLAQLWVGGRNLRLGKFERPEQAHAAYLSAKREFHDGCTI